MLYDFTNRFHLVLSGSTRDENLTFTEMSQNHIKTQQTQQGMSGHTYLQGYKNVCLQ